MGVCGVGEVYRVNVRTIAEYACASGSLAYNAALARRFQEGREGHRAIQERLAPEWQIEAPAAFECEAAGVRLLVQGRADAVCMTYADAGVIEIKTTRMNPNEILMEDYPVHWAQAEIYAHIFCAQGGKAGADVQLIYAGVRGGEKRFHREYTARELAERFMAYLKPYAESLAERERWQHASAPTLQALRFPFPEFRDGQREMAREVYRAMAAGARCMIEAPTGIGKTAAALFGALKALGAGKITSVFYLTARTTGRRAAENALALMRASGLKLRSVTVTAKEKICFQGKTNCGGCPYADSYYDKRRGALRDAMRTQAFGAEEIAALAREYEICPFELSLDLTELADAVICDYNYALDPRVYLKRHFERKSRAGLLIDEAHNLIDRAREMYSAALSGTAVGALRAQAAEVYGENDPLAAPLAALEASLKRPDAEYDAMSAPPEGLAQAASAFSDRVEALRLSDENTLELARACAWFARVARRFDDAAYRALIRPEGENDHIEVKLWCFAPEKYLDRLFARVGGVALFSATLKPIEFYAAQLAVTDKNRLLTLESPFPRENLFVARLPVSVKFRDRASTMEPVARVLHAMIEAHPGNYLACFPSHAYLKQAAAYYRTRYPDDEILCQQSGMGEDRRAAFLAAFRPGRQRSMLVFIVLGGVFSEGVDLPDDLLSGAAIISTGIPMVNPESELLRELYDDGFEGGTDAAYTYPGYRRVLQAAGRVIRSETDRGVVLLLDERYAAEKYRELAPSHWQVRRITSMSALNRQLRAFWNEKD